MAKCFDIVAEHFGPVMGEELIVCHGIVEARKRGEEGTTGHAWIEKGRPEKRIAVDPTAKIFMDRDVYRKDLSASNVIEYAPREYLFNWWRTGYPGPWDFEIKKYTRS